MKTLFSIVLCLICLACPCYGDQLLLKDKLKTASAGDFIVTAQGRIDTLLHIYSKEDNTIILEEITIPASQVTSDTFSWRNWVNQGAPGFSNWVMYKINLDDGSMGQPYSFSMNRFFVIPQSDNFLSQLLNLKMDLVPSSERKKSGAAPDNGAPDWRPLWHPPLIVNGKKVNNVFFDAYKTKWPRDGSELAGKTILVYLPDPNLKVPSYFPYWLEVTGLVGKAKVRIIDSGTGLISPKDKNFVKSLFNPPPPVIY